MFLDLFVLLFIFLLLGPVGLRSEPHPQVPRPRDVEALGAIGAPLALDGLRIHHLDEVLLKVHLQGQLPGSPIASRRVYTLGGVGGLLLVLLLAAHDGVDEVLNIIRTPSRLELLPLAVLLWGLHNTKLVDEGIVCLLLQYFQNMKIKIKYYFHCY